MPDSENNTESSELPFSDTQLMETARQLAQQQRYGTDSSIIRPIRPELGQIKQTLINAYKLFSDAVRNEQEISSAAEWVIDNFYIIQEHIVQVQSDFPLEFQKTIPVLIDGEFRGYPRVYELIQHMVLHTDNMVEIDLLTNFVQNFQKEETLTIGETWSIPIMIRMALLKQLHNRVKQVIQRKKLQKELNQLTSRLIEHDEQDGDPVVLINLLSEWFLSERKESGVQELTILYQLIQRNGLLKDEIRRWFRGRFKRLDFTLDEALNMEAQLHSRLQVSIKNTVVSLRHILEIDWKKFVERCSRTEQILRMDPAGIYPKMDFQTRDRYRQVVERLSRRSELSETEISETVLQMTANSSTDTQQGGLQSLLEDRSPLKSHVGYYLMDEGYEALVQRIGYRKSIRERLTLLFEQSFFWYFSFISLQTTVLLAILWVVIGAASYPAWMVVSLLLIALFPALDLSISSVNRYFAFFLSPRILPKMRFRNKIPDEARTLVVVPTLLLNEEDVRRQLEQLEVRSLANPEPGLQFALLGDFKDAPKRELDEDNPILNTANELIDELNEKASSRYGKRFFLLHRTREWNETEQVWMGWERKRGKLEELNRLLSDPNAKTGYRYITEGFLDSIQKKPVRFVITLDADTKMPPESARDLIRTAAHPLNRAHWDPESRKVVRGYGIIQPRISIPPESARKTWFTRIFSGNVGIDAYSTVVSDIYQDLMDEGVFTGKGIYDPEAFNRVLNNRFPTNRILSHDLIESNYLRAGLATSIELFDDFPSTYNSFSKRNHRWTRGDWQIASWLLPRVPGGSGKEQNPLNGLSRWKILDNLRRSLNSFFLMLFFLSGWFWLPGSDWIWTLAAFGIMAFPIYITLSTDLINRPARVRWKLYLGKVRSNLAIHSAQAILVLGLLPHQALVQLDAISRVLWRLSFSRRHLLEWTTASQVEREAVNSLGYYVRTMLISPLIGVSLPILALVTGQASLWIVIPFSILWIAAPWMAWRLSLPVVVRDESYSAEERQKLRSYARRTWFYFERYMTEEYSWLPPDNVQESPPLQPTARTSPTNIGLSLNSIHAAYSMGYITFSGFLDRVEKTIHSIKQLEKYKGHLYNWYDLRTNDILPPGYISTVDSGNLAAGLIVTAQALRQEFRSPILNKEALNGLVDTLLTLRELFSGVSEDSDDLQHLWDLVDELTTQALERLKQDTSIPPDKIAALLESCRPELSSLRELNISLLRQNRDQQEVENLAFWLTRPLEQVENHLAEYHLVESVSDQFKPEDLSAEHVAILLSEQQESLQPADPPPMAAEAIDWPERIERLSLHCEQMVEEMDFTFLYDQKRALFHIGFDVATFRLDTSTYDLFASEARIASYIAISRGQILPEHWFQLSRRLTNLRKNEVLLSWSGTMFEYLMPLLFMRSYPNTLLSHTYDCVVEWQREYAERRGFPWGASESAYYFLNLEMHYQYRAFGVPGLGMKRGLADEYVIAPYATMLALMVDPKEAYHNLVRLEALNGLGICGFYDAIDFTPTRLKDGESYKVVRSYMAHHHGMGLVAINNVLNGWKAHHFFHSDLQVRGCELLLQERVPRGLPVKEPHPIDVELEPREQSPVQMVVDHESINSLDRNPPRLHLLSNGYYSLMTSHTGTGYSRCGEHILNDWKPDLSSTPSGVFFYVRDLDSGEYWSTSHQPVRRKPDRYDSWFHNDRVVTSRVDEWVETTTEVCVSPEHPFELRRVTLTNYADRQRTIELTSYMDVALNKMADHSAHPAFSRLFLQTEYLPQQHALLVRRRPRSEDEEPVWMVHTMTGTTHGNGESESLQFETDKEAFVGRNRDLSSPAAMTVKERMEGRLGNVVHPILSLRRSFSMDAGEKVQFTYGLGVANSREEAVHLADMFQSRHATDRAFEMAMVYSSVELDHIGANSKQAQQFQRMLASLIYTDREQRAPESAIRENRKSQQGLWPYGISGDLPILLVRIKQPDQIKMVITLLKAHAFWYHKSFKVDLVLVNEHPPTYADELQEALLRQVEQYSNSQWLQKKGGIYLLRAEQLSDEDLNLLLSVAHRVVTARSLRKNGGGDLQEVHSWRPEDRPADSDSYRPVSAVVDSMNTLESTESPGDDPATGETSSQQESRKDRICFNGYGGFSPDGLEYRIDIEQDTNGRHRFPPAPWINVIANPSFGTIVSEKGAGYSWSGNSRENKLTGWSNEPIMDVHSEAIWVRDEDAGLFWSPMPGPVPGNGDYQVSHGFGYSRFEHISSELNQEVLQFVARDEPVKLTRITLENRSEKDRNLSLFGYMEWVLGNARTRTARHILTRSSQAGSAIYATNSYREEYQDRIAFATLVALDHVHCRISCTSDRNGFIGINRTLSDPLALSQTGPLDGQSVIGGDPCAAFQGTFTLKAGERTSFLLLAGETESREEVGQLIKQFSSKNAVDREYSQVTEHWERLLGKIHVELPDESITVLMNGWLMYQTICCRLWARTGFYQAGGAYGFRDQLQDVMAAWYADPALCKEQILLHAAHQFPEGDVLHWWHPPTGRGIRSRITDDRLWLPWVTLFYIDSSDDPSILDEVIPYIEARLLEEDEHEVYLQPSVSDTSGSLYEHCCRAIDISLQFGEHGLPLIGAGDWNDGMNRVGAEGKGESVWLGFFLVSILEAFIPVARSREDHERAEHYESVVNNLKERLNDEGWDGSWYLRAFFDDGTPLGSASSQECRIDAISQSWAVLSGVASPERTEQVLNAAEEFLVDEKERVIRLLTPPFDKGEKDPGYIQGYLPGVRENGGQYTHAALWLVMAMARAGHHEQAVRYLQMINPVEHALNSEEVRRYKVEPYVVAADVYGQPPLTGRGGWTWYTGSAGWMYRTVLEEMMGMKLNGRKLILTPPSSGGWSDYRIRLLLEDDLTTYEITVSSPTTHRLNRLSCTLDGVPLKEKNGSLHVPLQLDKKNHEVRVEIDQRTG
ncbi:MAG: glucoamylase family protein [Balneolaceae bacterium]